MRAAVTYVGNILVTHRPALSCRQDYSVSSLVLMFFTFSGIGWLWEVGLHLVVDGMFFNRGFMAGPWLPIYGTGGVLILVLLNAALLLLRKPLESTADAQALDDSDQKEETPLC